MQCNRENKENRTENRFPTKIHQWTLRLCVYSISKHWVNHAISKVTPISAQTQQQQQQMVYTRRENECTISAEFMLSTKKNNTQISMCLVLAYLLNALIIQCIVCRVYLLLSVYWFVRIVIIVEVFSGRTVHQYNTEPYNETWRNNKTAIY